MLQINKINHNLSQPKQYLKAMYGKIKRKKFNQKIKLLNDNKQSRKYHKSLNSKGSASYNKTKYNSKDKIYRNVELIK